MPGQATFDDVRDILNNAAVELGLSGAEEFPLESDNPIMAQLVACLRGAGRALVRKYEWPQLRRPYSFTTQAGRSAYGLPPDVLQIIPNTMWMAGTNQPLQGPLSPAEWQALLRTGVGATVYPFFRVDMPTITLLPTPASTRTVTLEFWSRYWVYGVDDGDISRDTPQSSDDQVWLDAPLITAATKLRWLTGKQMPSDAVKAEYDEALDSALSTANTASALVVGTGGARPLLLGAQNLPDSGWGRY